MYSLELEIKSTMHYQVWAISELKHQRFKPDDINDFNDPTVLYFSTLYLI